MGIINVTPDSFSDGNKDYLNVNEYVKKIKNMEKLGAAIIDIGAESTRPGSNPVNSREQINRSIPLIKKVKNEINIPISIDTSDPEVMEEAIKNGASFVNDVRGLCCDNALYIIKKYDVQVCISHNKGCSTYMQTKPSYENIISEIYNYFFYKIKKLEAYGIKKDKIIIDPGFGFGKTFKHNINILNSLSIFNKIKSPILVGLSRKSIIGNIIKKDVKNRLYGSLSAELLAFLNGANIIRTHNVKACSDVLKVATTIKKYKIK